MPPLNPKSKPVLYVVGAGPGDPELLTLKAKRLLQQAELIAYDDLIHPAILGFAPPHCQLLSVGYRGKVHESPSTGQQGSTHSLVHPEILKALEQGLRVVRLKCGDPLVFGRSGEEAAILSQHGFSSVFVPGITAAFGAASAAGIPLTDRRLASSVTLMTGHRGGDCPLVGFPHDNRSPPDQRPEVKAVDGTLAVYMPRKHLKELCQDLIREGWDPQTPLAFIVAATTRSQRVYRATLSQLDPLDRALEGHLPGLALIGATVGLGREVSDQQPFESGFEDGLEGGAGSVQHARPLHGMRLVLLRSHGGPSRMAPALKRLGADVVEYPLMTPVVCADKESSNAQVLKKLLLNPVPGAQIYLRRTLDAQMFLQALPLLGIDLRQVSRDIKFLAGTDKTLRYVQRHGLQAEKIVKQETDFLATTIVPCSFEEKIKLGQPWPCYNFIKRAIKIKAPEPDAIIVPHQRALDEFLRVSPQDLDWYDRPWIALGSVLESRLRSLGATEVRVAPALADVVEQVYQIKNPIDQPSGLPAQVRVPAEQRASTQGEGQLIVYTGQGKGKTTAALGLVFRAMGYGRKVGVVQFIKGKWPTGERRFAATLPGLDFFVMGKGFTWDSDDLAQDRSLARKAWEKSQQLIHSGQYDVVILDEITYVINYGFVDAAEVAKSLMDRPPGVSVIVTGRKAHPLLLEIADVVTDMQEVKHPFKSGQKAKQGLDY